MNKFKFFLEILINYLFFLIVILPLWLNKKFGFVYLDQFIIHFQMEVLGLIDGDTKIYKSGIRWLIIFPLVLSIIVTIFRYIYLELRLDYSIIIKFFKKLIKIIKKKNFLFLNLIFKKILLSRIYLILLLILSIFFFLQFTNFFNYKKNNTSNNSYLDENYLKPSVSINKRKNLIVLYVESLEQTYANENIFGENLIKEITSNKDLKSVDKYYQIPGTGYTVHAFIASQCGIPLLKIGLISGGLFENVKRFLPNLDCLTDILKKENFKNILITSDNVESGGFDAFANSHNYDEIYGLGEIAKLGYQTSRRAWHFSKKNWHGGIHDNILLDFLIDQITQNYKSNQNFFISAHTLDLHSPKGYPNPKCLKNYHNLKKDEIYNINHSIKCSSIYISKFLQKYKRLNLKNTNLVIIGDHLFMGDFAKKSERNIYNGFFLDQNLDFKREEINVFDFFPTFLNLAGFNILNENSKAGLGFSIFGISKEYKKIDFIFNSNSKLFDNFWYEKN
ncbi:arylsulfatase [alpha proteobacterium HIMB5]|nr:arylsulfatase [alpha proteobacterium HIMB5]